MRPSEIDYSRDVDLRMYAMIRAGWLAGSEVRQVGIPELLGVGAGFVKLSSVRSWQERGTRIVFNESPLRTESLRTMVGLLASLILGVLVLKLILDVSWISWRCRCVCEAQMLPVLGWTKEPGLGSVIAVFLS